MPEFTDTTVENDKYLDLARELQKYKIYLAATPLFDVSITLAEIEEKDNVFKLLNILEPQLQSNIEHKAAASVYCKYWGSMLVTSQLYLAAHHQVMLQIDKKCSFLETKADRWQPTVRIKNMSMIALADKNREQRIQLLLEHINGLIVPIFKKLNGLTGISYKILWSNLSFALHWAYQEWLESAHEPRIKAQLKADYKLLQQHFSINIAGVDLQFKPNYKSIKHPCNTNAQWKIRQTCCLRHNLPSAGHCSTCPKITEADRIKLLQNH